VFFQLAIRRINRDLPQWAVEFSEIPRSSSAPKPDNPVDLDWMNWEPLVIGDEVMAVWLGETRNLKR